MDEQAPAVSLNKISKTFSGIRALHEVSLRLWPGRVHGLAGMNGSGKSTLIKILAGIYRPDAGGTIEYGYDRYGGHEPSRSRWSSTLRRTRPGLSTGFVH